MIFTLRIDQHPEQQELEAVLARIFDESTDFVGARTAPANHIVQYELTQLEGRSFHFELCLFLNLQEALVKGYFNDFEVARALSEDFLGEVVVSTHTDQPNLWVLLRQGQPYLFESDELGDDSVVVNEAKLLPLDIETVQHHHVGRESIEKALRQNQNDVPVFLKATSWWNAQKQA